MSSRNVLMAVGVLLALTAVAKADPQKFSTEDGATKFCKTGNVVWYNADSKIYFAPGSQFYGKTKTGGYTCKTLADKEGYQPNKGN
jgi:hypothetical protein